MSTDPTLRRRLPPTDLHNGSTSIPTSIDAQHIYRDRCLTSRSIPGGHLRTEVLPPGLPLDQSQQLPDSPTQLTRTVKLLVRTPRTTAEYERLEQLGVRFTQPPVSMGPVTVAVLDDTCGNLIQIAAPND